MRITLSRTGQRPVEFDGDVLVELSTKDSDKVKRWHTVTVYRATVGYVLSVVYLSDWDSERPHHFVEVLPDLGALAGTLERYQPLTHVIGYPPGEQFRGRQERIEREVRMRWQDLAMRALEAVPGTAESL